MHRVLRTRLLSAWRARDPGRWLDVALAAVLSLAAVWLVVDGTQGQVAGGSAFVLRPDGAVLPETGPPEFAGEPPPEVLVDGEQSGWTAVDLVLSLLTTVPLLARRRWPLACLTVQLAGMLNVDGVSVATVVAVLIGSYSLAVYGRSALLSMSALLVAAGAAIAFKQDTWPELPGWAGVFALILPVGLFGVAMRAARSRAQASKQRAEALERGQEAATRLAVAQERARIARELHDVVSHHVSVMTIQAGAAGKVLDADPGQARGALSAIEASGRETMAELRHLLGLLAPGPADDPLHPQPGLDQLDALIEKIRQAGQPLSVRRTPAELPRGIDLTAYRVVQEALTNALRYAPGARTDVTISEEGAELMIEVTNDEAPPGTPRTGAGSGTGLLGLAERLRLYEGTLETGRRGGGGFRVLARMPLERPQAAVAA